MAQGWSLETEMFIRGLSTECLNPFLVKHRWREALLVNLTIKAFVLNSEITVTCVLASSNVDLTYWAIKHYFKFLLLLFSTHWNTSLDYFFTIPLHFSDDLLLCHVRIKLFHAHWNNFSRGTASHTISWARPHQNRACKIWQPCYLRLPACSGGGAVLGCWVYLSTFFWFFSPLLSKTRYRAWGLCFIKWWVTIIVAMACWHLCVTEGKTYLNGRKIFK